MTSELESSAIRSIAREFEENGYTVFIEPNSSLIPFDLHNYRPDILATNDRENVIVEVKSRASPRTIERYKEIAEIVAKHDGWRFMLSTVDDRHQSESSAIKANVDAEAIPRMLDRLDCLFETENYDLALPYLWTAYISGMRIIGQKHGIPMDMTADRSVINYMYSLGEISNEEFEKSRLYLDLRNRLTHTFDLQVPKEEAMEMREFVKNKLIDWGFLASQ